MTIDDNKKRFTDIYNRESDSLFRFCIIRVTDREKALDITQETFARLWNSIYEGKEVNNPRALLYVVARNLIIDWYRRVKPVSLENLSKEDNDDREFNPEDKNVVSEMEITSDARRVLEILNNLEPKYRELIYFRYMEGLSPRDIGEIMNLDANTVSVRLTRGMDALRKLIGIKDNKRNKQ